MDMDSNPIIEWLEELGYNVASTGRVAGASIS